MDKSGVPKEAQDDALSDDTTGGRQTPTGRPAAVKLQQGDQREAMWRR